MNEDGQDGGKGKKLVQMEEGLVEGMANGGRGLEEYDNHGYRSKQAILYEWLVIEMLFDPRVPLGGMHIDRPRTRMGDSLQYHDPAYPPMEQVVGIEANAQEWNQWIVPAGQDHERNHVDDSQMACSAPDFCNQGILILFLEVEEAAVDDVAR